MSTAVADAPAASLTGRARSAALITLLVASAMELLDMSIVNVALPSIEADLGATGTDLQWMVAAYPLAFAIAMITGSRLGDRFGRKRLFVGGLVAFVGFSAACGLAPTAGALIVFRALQGIGAAAMIPQVMTSIQVMYRPEERAAAMGAFASLAGIATVGGPIIGAVLTEADVLGTGWRAIFLVNVPVGIAAVAAAIRFVPESTSQARPSFDPTGIALLGGGLLAILYPLTLGRELGWPTWVFALMVVGAAALVAFVVLQRRLEGAGREPLVAMSLYRGRAFSGGSVVLAVMFVGLSAYFVAITVYLQAGLGWSVMKAGVANLPFALTTAVMAGVSVSVIAPRIGRRVLQLGAGTLAAGALMIAATVQLADATTSAWAFVPAFVVAGAGFGLMVAPIGMFTIAEVPVEQAGSASGLFNTTTALANAVGVAVIGTVFFQVAESQGAALPSEIFGPALQVVLVVLAALMAVAAVAARLLPEEAPEEVAELH